MGAILLLVQFLNAEENPSLHVNTVTTNGGVHGSDAGGGADDSRGGGDW